MSAHPAAPRTVAEYIATLPDTQRVDARRLHTLIRKTAPTLKLFLSSSGVGYGPMHVRYASGREVDWFVVGLAGRKRGLALHVMLPADGSPMPELRKDRFPKGDVGKSCVRFRRLADLEEASVVALVRAAVRAQKTWAGK
ncbi:MAG TPA: DUF1801 domain-containing protein [Candidatus Limnocylindria bacterium]|nr:DUF1801 domain-containing protein [Candidatus Limnocylindria bacterium]